MNKRHIRHVMRTEWRKTKKTPAQLIMMLVVPVVAVLFLSWSMCYVRTMVNNYHASVFLPDEETTEKVDSYFSEFYLFFDFRCGTREDAENLVHEGKSDCALVVNDDEIRILYDSSMLTSSMALKDASDCADDLVLFLEGQEYMEEAYSLYPETEMVDLSTDTERLVNHFDTMASLIGMILFLMMGSNAMTISSRSITGEKERQTFDSLVLCPASLRKIIFGKELVMLIEVFVSGLVGILAAVAGMAIWYPKEFGLMTEAASKDPRWIAAILLMLLMVTILITGVFSIISSAFSQAKKASLFSSAGMVIISIAAMLPTFIESKIVECIPVANWSPVIKHLCKNEAVGMPLLISLAISVLLGSACMILSSGLWERTSE